MRSSEECSLDPRIRLGTESVLLATGDLWLLRELCAWNRLPATLDELSRAVKLGRDIIIPKTERRHLLGPLRRFAPGSLSVELSRLRAVLEAES